MLELGVLVGTMFNIGNIPRISALSIIYGKKHPLSIHVFFFYMGPNLTMGMVTLVMPVLN
jgi:hypothetical protein